MAVKFSQFDVADSQADISHLVGYKDTENVQITPAKINESNTLDSVTDNGSTTTNNLTANSFIKSGGTSTQFLKADGSVDSTDYTNAVDSVNGETGVVVLDTDDVAQGATNLYNQTHTGEVTGATVLTIADNAVTQSKIASNAVGASEIQSGAVDTDELADDSVTYAKLGTEFTTSAALSTNVDFSTAQVFTKTLGSDTTLTFSNAEIGMVKDLVITGSHTLTLPAGSTVAGTYDGSVSNLIQVVVTGASEYWFSISQAQ